MTSFYWELTGVSRTILQVIGEGLNLTEEEKELIAHQHSGHNNQLRLLYYPPVPAEALETQIVARMPAHSDWR
jgi:isopenicillin N synthase-like dioxygenase